MSFESLQFIQYFSKRLVFIDLKNNQDSKDGKSTRNLGEAYLTSEFIKYFVQDMKNFYAKVG